MNPQSILGIAAFSRETSAIGINNHLPWPKITTDFLFIKQLTTEKPTGLIMGRKTFQSIGRVLPGRTTLVLSSSPKEKIVQGTGEAYFLSSLEEALSFCREKNISPVIFGGASLYRELLLKYPCTIYLTVIEESFPGDTFFPIDLIEKNKLKNITELVYNRVSNENSIYLSNSQSISEASLHFSFYSLEHLPKK
ncbi:dihydrofolate reductase [Nematocida sp. LUAm3]|nr:dihydrofolate reductase [Nematocida sp. LUAm3]KAI5174680.1 dihydrofolate reductase [Nematocida sp. LUAm2]KAI5177909.1 dihydrofolate reductase [Nematocida sp. LUAm1]